MEVVKKYEKCVWCNKALQPIGNARLIGANHEDWESRTSHKKCWIENEMKRGLKRPPPSEEFKRVMHVDLSCET